MRFSRARNLDIFVRIGLFINPDHWDKKRQRIRNLNQATDNDLINITLDKLSGYMLSRMNRDYIEGALIDEVWVTKTLDDFFHQPEQENMCFLRYCEAPILRKLHLVYKRTKGKAYLSVRL